MTDITTIMRYITDCMTRKKKNGAIIYNKIKTSFRSAKLAFQ
jgi:hypothetical protein